jgi:4-amino-4-deoxy-L-arabinose transferase-like glycosyltransferase
MRKFWVGTYLNFSDGAKYADIARNVITMGRYESNFSFYSSGTLGEGVNPVAQWVPPLMPLAIAGVFQLVGASDFGVTLTSSLFYILLIFITFFLGKRLYGNLVGILSGIAVAFNVNLLEYAISGASETLFTFEIVLGVYLFVLKGKWTKVAGFLVLILMYLTRAQAIIYILGLLLLLFIVNFPLKRALGYFAATFAGGALLFFLNSKQATFAITHHFPGVTSSDSLRGAVQEVSISGLFSKVFYNLYNFYRLLPQIISPYMWTLFMIGLFKWGRDRIENSFKITTIFVVVLTFLATAVTIPLFRYLHPIVPLVYISAVAILVWIVRQIGRDKNKVVIVTSILVFLFVVGQTLGVIILDSRYKAKTTNKGKPPVYVVLSTVLKENTNPESLVVTNLDTWGSWYGERRTVWYPLAPEQLDIAGGENLFGAIYLTSYLMDDENYYMGPAWRQVFLNPNAPEDKFISENFKLEKVFEISSDETYEKQPARAVLLVRK